MEYDLRSRLLIEKNIIETEKDILVNSV